MNIDDPLLSNKLLMSANKIVIKSLKNLWLVPMCFFPWDGPLNGFLTKYGLFEVWFGLKYFCI